MFKRANRSELRTWILGDIFLFLIAGIASIAMFGTGKVGTIIAGVVFVLIAALCVFFLFKMIIAYRTYDERKEQEEKDEEERKKQEELEKEELLKQEEKEREELQAEYEKKTQEVQAKVKAEIEENRRIEEEKKKNNEK